MTQPQQCIIIRGARENNLQNISLDIPRDQLVVVTGLSGSGKSSLAFDTIYAEGQRRYLESLSAYARQFIGMLERPDVDHIDGLSPVIAIGQKTVSRNPRSTVGTVTEVYDFLRLLFARVGTPYSPVTGRPLRKQSTKTILDALEASDPGKILTILAPVVRGRKGHYRERFQRIGAQGFTRVRVDGKIRNIVPGMALARYKTHDIEVVVDRLKVRDNIRRRLRQSINAALELGSGTLFVSSGDEADRVFSKHLFDPATGISYGEASPGLFSFNSPYGACAACNGLGYTKELAEELVIPDKRKSIRGGGIAPISDIEATPRLASLLVSVAEKYGFKLDTAIGHLRPDALHMVLHGCGDEHFAISFRGSYGTHKVRYEGIYAYLRHLIEVGSPAVVRRMRPFIRRRTCPACQGSRLKKEARTYRIADRPIAALVDLDLYSLLEFLKQVQLTARQQQIAQPILKEISERLTFMIEVGVGYLNLDRMARTLSGGESQRIRLATQIGTQLTGVLYVLDEPSIGLHPRDNRKLIASLRQLRDIGNSVLVVEHDREMIECADYVIDLGPGAGEHGGHVVCAGRPDELALRTNGRASLTAEYLTGERTIALPPLRRRPGKRALVLEGAMGHNLKGDTLVLPLGLFVCVSGVSGSGKSTLINQTLRPILGATKNRTPLPYTQVTGKKLVGKVIAIDQKPIGRTPRSNPATYIKLFDRIRDLFAKVKTARIRGYKKGRFSFNVKGGRCEDCKGAGIVRLEMNFLPDVFVTCDSCGGKRYNKETLQVRYKGRTIADVLDMTVDDAMEFFADLPRLARKVRTLQSVGLGYIRLGQQSTTISGGEAQRIKLARELSRPGTGDTLYILDEPTTGLHFEDIRYLLAVLQALVDRGNTVLIIEHNMDVIKVADHIVDLGPDGGAAGGHILFAGSPEALAMEDTHTGVVLRDVLGVRAA